MLHGDIYLYIYLPAAAHYTALFVFIALQTANDMHARIAA